MTDYKGEKLTDYQAEVLAATMDVVSWEKSPQEIADTIASVAQRWGKSTEEVALEVDAGVKEYRIREYNERIKASQVAEEVVADEG